MLTEQLWRGRPLVPFYRSAVVEVWKTRVALRLAVVNKLVSFILLFTFNLMLTFRKFLNLCLNFNL